MRAGNLHILVGIDFSDSSAGAMYHALALAERISAVLHICHITPKVAHLDAQTDLGLNIPPEFQEALQARQRLERIRGMIGSKVQVDLHLRMGAPVRGILDLVGELEPDMLIVGSHGFGAVLRLFLGSVSTELTRLSPVPVLVVPAPGRQAALLEAPRAIETPSRSGIRGSGEVIPVIDPL